MPVKMGQGDFLSNALLPLYLNITETFSFRLKTRLELWKFWQQQMMWATSRESSMVIALILLSLARWFLNLTPGTPKIF